MLDTEKEKHMKQLKKKLECWREIILPVNSILLWDKTWYPAVIFNFITFVFLLIWWMEPAFLTMISMSLLLLALTDYLVPILISTFIPQNSWNGLKERKFDEICQKVSDMTLQVRSIWRSILSARNNRPNIYYSSTTVCLSLLAWVGNVIDNLLLIYLMLMVALLLPGLRHKGRARSAVKWAYNYVIHRKQA